MTLAAAFLALAACSVPAAAHNFRIGSIVVRHPWSRATPPVTPVAAGYLTLTNEGAEAERLVSISSPLAKRVEIHASTVTEGVASMRPLAEGVAIAPGETAELQPGGTHAMFMQPARPLKEGERFTATLTFEKAGAVDVEFAVEGMGARPAPAGEHDGHDGASAR